MTSGRLPRLAGVICLVLTFSCQSVPTETTEDVRLTDPDLKAATPGGLPSDGPFSVAGVELPSGHQVRPDPSLIGSNGSGLEPVLWITDEIVDDVGILWAQVASRFDQTGLWPVVFGSLDPVTESAGHPCDPGPLDPTAGSDPEHVEVSSLLARWWRQSLPSEDEPFLLEAVEPFGRAFPGLAPESKARSDDTTPAQLARDLRGCLGLVGVERPADVPAVLGWQGPLNYYSDMGELSAVLRSWEDRFGGVVVGMGFDTLTLAARRPPRGTAMAEAVAAEQFAVCPDIVWQGTESIAALAEEIEGNAVWFCWWD